MISDSMLDKLLPLQTEDALAAQLTEELAQEGFAVTSYKPGGVFYTLLRVVVRLYNAVMQLLRSVVGNSYISHADADWLEIKAADYAKLRKEAVKAQGYVTLTRTAAADAQRVYKGHVFKTLRDVNGEELRYFCTDDTVLPRGRLTVQVPVEAERAGARYNVPPGQLCRSLTYIDDVAEIANTEGWLTREGSDQEDVESFRQRVLRSWAELSGKPTRDKLLNVCEAVPGVLFARVDDNHPRGQGTVDVIVTGTAGNATDLLLQQVREAAGAILGPYDNLLVKSSETVAQDIDLTVTLPAAAAETEAEITQLVTAAVTRLLQISRDRELNILTRADIIYTVKCCSASIRNVLITQPAADVTLPADKVLVLGGVTTAVRRG